MAAEKATVVELRLSPDVVGEYSRIISYPSGCPEATRARIIELNLLGVERLVLEGRVEIGRYRVLGKGTTSLVVKGVIRGGRLVTVKMLRTDANRDSLLHEARMLKLANSVGVGPGLIAYSRNFLVWEYVDGVPLGRWLASRPDPGTLRRVMRAIFDQLHALDRIGLVHGQLSRPKEHVLIRGEKPVIIDFETSSLESRRKNLTQLAHILFRDEHVREALGVRWDRVVELLRMYKRDMSVYPRLLSELGL